MRWLHSVFAALGLVVALFATAQQARADQDYGSFVVRNPSLVTIHYQVKWGNGEWKWFSVPPGRSRYHAYRLDGNGRVPSPEVRFDYIAGDNQITWKTYRMGVYAAGLAQYGKPHVFRYSGCGRYVDLYQE